MSGENLSKVELAYAVLRDRIVSSWYALGQRLVIDSLADDLGVSQAPIREALRRLQAEGLVEYGATSGPSVVRLDVDQWFSLMEMKAVMEAYATRAAAPLLSAGDMAALGSANRQLHRALDEFDLEAWTDINRKFHGLICSRCPNAVLTRALQRVSEWADTVSSLVFARERGIIIQALGLSAGRETIGFHERIVDALQGGGGDYPLEELCREHTMALVRRVREKLGEEGPA